MASLFSSMSFSDLLTNLSMYDANSSLSCDQSRKDMHDESAKDVLPSVVTTGALAVDERKAQASLVEASEDASQTTLLNIL